MTGNVSQADATMKPVPKSCPKCGWLNPTSLVAHFVGHLFREHRDAYGTAVRKEDETNARSFFYIAPVPGTSTLWWVIYADDATEVARLDHSRNEIRWHKEAT